MTKESIMEMMETLPDSWDYEFDIVANYVLVKVGQVEIYSSDGAAARSTIKIDSQEINSIVTKLNMRMIPGDLIRFNIETIPGKEKQ
jgi:hypothetical protein